MRGVIKIVYIIIIFIIIVICFNLIAEQANYSKNDKYWFCVNGHRNRKHISRNNECVWAIISESDELIVSTTYVRGCNGEFHTVLLS